jgi:hypothetical protein
MPSLSLRPLAAVLGAVLLFSTHPHADAAPFLKQGDVVALVGGEDLVVAAEDGSIESALLLANPTLNLRFRSLAWEGDTVFDQPRDLNYPTLPDQLQRVGATVVLVQFGLIESLAGPAKLADFTSAYEQLLDHLAADGRRVALITPGIFEQSAGVPIDRGESNRALASYREAIGALAKKRRLPCIDLAAAIERQPRAARTTRDGLHLNAAGRQLLANAIASGLSETSSPQRASDTILGLVREKNRLWFNYYRPQNWAFLAGDRTNQPSSRDHIDPTKRWFPAEMEQFLPLIAAKEKEIAAATEHSH